MRARLFILFSIVSLGILYSQNASDILAKVSNAYSENSGYVLIFTLNSEDVASKTTYSHDGKAYIKGNKFKMVNPKLVDVYLAKGWIKAPPKAVKSGSLRPRSDARSPRRRQT